MTSLSASFCAGLDDAVGLPPGLSTHMITNSPIMHMMRSASVKIHSGHSSHSTSLHWQALLDMVHRGGAEYAEAPHSFRPRTLLLIPSRSTSTLTLMSRPTFQPPSRRYVRS